MPDNIGLAWGLTIAASLSTLAGAAIAVRKAPPDLQGGANNVPLFASSAVAAALSLAAGVMLFVAVAELFGKSEEHFVLGGQDAAEAKLSAVLSFFGGACLVLGANGLAKRLAPADSHGAFELTADKAVGSPAGGGSGGVAAVAAAAAVGDDGWGMHDHGDGEGLHAHGGNGGDGSSGSAAAANGGDGGGASAYSSQRVGAQSVDDYLRACMLAKARGQAPPAVVVVPPPLSALAAADASEAEEEDEAEEAGEKEETVDAAAAVAPATAVVVAVAQPSTATDCGGGGSSGSSAAAAVTIASAPPPGAADPGGAAAAAQQARAAAAMYRLGLSTVGAIALHNFPEGLAAFLATVAERRTGLGIAFGVILHNVPEGLCVAAPLYAATRRRGTALVWAAAAGAAELCGGFVGWLLVRGDEAGAARSVDGVLFGSLFGIVNGIVVVISCLEFLPKALQIEHNANAAARRRWAAKGDGGRGGAPAAQHEVVPACFVLGMALIAVTLVAEAY
jgi:ZIP family zinc transporter